ncbi:MAG: amino acid ABC transporter permease [Spirochaetaceae bacterium]|jgi:putative glutamine transport system permease protein|nr:amino acid ABC transporter permease [Spirochaetaceae bacterium]
MLAQVLRDVFTGDNVLYLFSGVGNTLLISIVTIVLSILIGSVLGICRNYSRGPAQAIAASYIELFRNTPLLLWMMICVFLLRFGTSMTRGTLALTLYTSSVIAEIIRGGLNSIAKGQFEAARSQGFSFTQTLYYIILPQCFKRVAPSLLSQVITTVKDTSFLAQFAIAELFWNSKVLMGNLPQKTQITSAHIFVVFIFVAAVYFIINFALSCVVRKLSRDVSGTTTVQTRQT